MQDSVINEVDFVELGLACGDICQSLDQGMKAGGTHQPGLPVFEAIGQLMM